MWLVSVPLRGSKRRQKKHSHSISHRDLSSRIHHPPHHPSHSTHSPTKHTHTSTPPDMSRRIGQPVNQVRLTNVAMVRMHKGGKRFEIACYRNKVLSWRQGVETDIDEVLQTHAIFLNVSKGVLASSKDLMDCFGQDNVEALLRQILEKGEYHPSDKEREAMLESTYRDIATIVAEKSVNPASNRPYTVKMILSGMKEIHFAVNPTRNAKQQALEVIKKLRDVMPLDRAKMHLRAVCPTAEDLAEVVAGLRKMGIDTAAAEAAGTRQEMDLLVDPGVFRSVDELVRGAARGSLQVLELNVQQEGEADVDFEIARKEMMKRHQQEEIAAKAVKAVEARDDVQEESGMEKEEDKDVLEEGEKDEWNASGGGGRGDAREEEGEGKNAKNKGNKTSKAGKRREKERLKEREVRKQQDAERRQQRENGDSTASLVSTTISNTSGGREKMVLTWQKKSAGGTRLACNTCRVDFDDAKGYREHYRTDWHRYNLKLKEKGGGPVGEKEFEIVDADEMFFQDRGV